jgi:hypothetical protein
VAKNRWICDWCGRTFKTREECEEHEKGCSDNRNNWGTGKISWSKIIKDDDDDLIMRWKCN